MTYNELAVLKRIHHRFKHLVEEGVLPEDAIYAASTENGMQPYRVLITWKSLQDE